MTQTYRTDDLARWGTGQGFNLTPAQADINFWDLIQRMLVQEARPDPSAGIESFSITGVNLYVHMTDATVLGPYVLPYAIYRSRGTWSASTSYAVLDTFDINGGLYVVLVAHTSDLTFDAGANDGMGNDYYQLMLQPPGTALPTGGATGQVLEKSTDDDFAFTWGYKLPEGGTTGQVLKKQSSSPQDTDWDDLDASEVSFTPATGSSLSSDIVSDALEEIQSNVDTLEATVDGIGGDGSPVGTQTIWLPAYAMTPLITDGCASGIVELIANQSIVRSMDYPAGDFTSAQFEIAMPKSWDGEDIYCRIFWSHADGGSTWDVIFRLRATNAFVDGNNIDQFLGNNVQIADTGGNADTLYITDLSDPLNIGTSDFPTMIIFNISRRGEIDDLDIPARVQGVQIYYTTNTGNDNEDVST